MLIPKNFEGLKDQIASDKSQETETKFLSASEVANHGYAFEQYAKGVTYGNSKRTSTSIVSVENDTPETHTSLIDSLYMFVSKFCSCG